MGSNLILAAQFSAQVFKTLYGTGVDFTPKVLLQTIGDQLAPFPLIAVCYPGNKVVILPGPQHFVMPLVGQQYPCKRKMVAFLNDSADENLA